jgi:hypothetical protein
MSAGDLSTTGVVDSAPPTCTIRRLGERIAIVRCGPLLDGPNARAFAGAVLRAAAAGACELVLDFSPVREHGWPAIHVLCALEAHLVEACCAPVAVVADLSLTADLRAVALDGTWWLHDGLADALADVLVAPLDGAF